MDKTDNNKKLVLEKLSDSNGIISTACNNANLSRAQFYVWLKEDEDFAKAVDMINEAAIDHVESKLLEKINGVTVRKGIDEETGENITYDIPPSDTAIIFFLKCKAKKRGYVERQEVEHSGQLGITWHEEKTYETKDDISKIETKDIDKY